MADNEIRAGGIGVSLELIVYQKGKIKDISGVTGLQMIFKKPSGATTTETATLSSDGKNGRMRYITTNNAFLDEEGVWERQGKFTDGGVTVPTDITDFEVFPNLA